MTQKPVNNHAPKTGHEPMLDVADVGGYLSVAAIIRAWKYGDES